MDLRNAIHFPSTRCPVDSDHHNAPWGPNSKTPLEKSTREIHSKNKRMYKQPTNMRVDFSSGFLEWSFKKQLNFRALGCSVEETTITPLGAPTRKFHSKSALQKSTPEIHSRNSLQKAGLAEGPSRLGRLSAAIFLLWRAPKTPGHHRPRQWHASLLPRRTARH